MIGLIGAHRTGKTTLAKAYAEEMEVPYVETSSSAVFERLGYSPKVDYDFGTRMIIQNAILDDAIVKYSQHTGMFVTDRTPIDMLAYTIADIQRQNLSLEQSREFIKYFHRCFEESNKRFMCLTLIQPGIEIVDAPGKAPANPAYMEHLNTIMLGLLVGEFNSSSHFYLPRRTTDMQERVEALKFVVNKVVSRDFENIETLKAKGISIH
ncbi:AAA domain containing protein [uncultured Caudovirales phage]|uniref:AAA domain containing protein n=1 Tax=uncultured Caudovirales phage TaxID=2100421 RepID=A0A6J5KRK3_9CAUD|nr:AAA domain containing protein [uncultured Caudovirales phage]CAB4123876.1 AAA domain containing protein [uncultured Caudovirales phage]CAB5219326.1 AAA domain containing protein [uncultured Caudovirales phage]